MNTLLPSVIVCAGFTLLLAAPARPDILNLSQNNGVIAKFNGGTVGTSFASGLGLPTGIAFDTAGNLFISELSHRRIMKASPSGAVSVFAASGLLQAVCIAFDRAGNLYAADQGDATIVKFTPNGVRSVFARAGVGWVTGMAFDAADNLYTANSEDGTIVKFTPSGGRSVFAYTGAPFMGGLAFDSAGNLFLAEPSLYGSQISKFTPAGVRSTFISSSALLDTRGLAFDSAGNLYASYASQGTVEKYSPTGVDLGAAASAGFYNSYFLAFTDDAGVPLPLANQRAVPEPSAAVLLGLGLLALPGAARSATRRR